MSNYQNLGIKKIVIYFYYKLTPYVKQHRIQLYNMVNLYHKP
ncbi:hypothetical protein ES705_13326 [subsurface metagenome]